MLTVADRRFRSGKVCPVSGVYEFDGYLNGASDELPYLDELEIVIRVGEVFPLIANRGRDCYWQWAGPDGEPSLLGSAPAHRP